MKWKSWHHTFNKMDKKFRKMQWITSFDRPWKLLFFYLWNINILRYVLFSNWRWTLKNQLIIGSSAYIFCSLRWYSWPIDIKHFRKNVYRSFNRPKTLKINSWGSASLQNYKKNCFLSVLKSYGDLDASKCIW